MDASGTVSHVPLYRVNSLEVPNVESSDYLASELDLAPFCAIEGYPVDGLLGNNFLQEVSFGYQNEGNTLYFGMNSDRRFNKILPLDFEHLGIPRVKEISIEGLEQDCRFELDTGSSYELTLPATEFDLLVRKGRIHSLSTSTSNVAFGVATRRCGRLANATIWENSFTDVPVLEGTTYRIGLPLLQRFDFYFDFKSNQLLITPFASTNLPFLYEASGLHFLNSEKGETTIIYTDADSPAEHAGILANDVLLTIDARQVLPHEIEEYRKLFSTPSHKAVKLSVSRNGKISNHTIELRDFRNTTAR